MEEKGEPMWLISIHAPPRGATLRIAASRACTAFQFTPLREGRLCVQTGEELPSEFQFTPLREGRRTHMVRRLHLRRISIHAPPRGATRRAGWRIQTLHFNSRPSARGDGQPCTKHHRRHHFNSRPSARGDNALALSSTLGEISIHAPPRGATTLGALLKTEREKFQFTPLREGRRCLVNK